MRLRKALAANLKRLRLVAKLSQEELAHRADMDRTYISSLERGNYAATVDTLERIAEALGVEPVELLRSEASVTK
jgi:transcriptional regulator with XRE-family HTH domain